MEYLREILIGSKNVKTYDEYVNSVDKYSLLVDEILLTEEREGIKCKGEKIKINNNLYVYKSTLETITDNSAALSIYIPSRKNSYTLYFSFRTGKFVGNHTERDEGTGLRIEGLYINLNKIEIFDKNTKKWKLMDGVSKDLKNQLIYDVKIALYNEIFNTSYNKNLFVE